MLPHDHIETIVILAVFGARGGDDDVTASFLNRHDRSKLREAVENTISHLDGHITRRGVAREMDIDTVEAIIITKALEPIVDLVYPALEHDVHARKIQNSPYTRVTG